MTRKLCIKQPIGKAKHKNTKQQHLKTLSTPDVSGEIQDDIYMPNTLPGQHFHMDFGFVRGSGFKETQDRQTITSNDGFKSYLLIMDRTTQYTRILLQSSKETPLTVIKLILTKFKTTNPHRTVRTDQGGELEGSIAFKHLLAHDDLKFSLELTGADASTRNGRCENPNRIYGQMMRCMFHTVGLGPAYWSYALIYTIDLNNRLPHTIIKMTSFESFTGNKLNLDRIRVFGCHTSVKQPGKRKEKSIIIPIPEDSPVLLLRLRISTSLMISLAKSKQELTPYSIKLIWLHLQQKHR